MPSTPISNNRPYRDSASFGRRQEYVVIAELLRRGFDVYMTLVDDQGIDCIVRLDDKRYVDIQIKARSEGAKNWGTFAAMTVEPRDNYWFVFYTEKNNQTWVIPSRDVVRLGRQNKSGKGGGKWRIDMPKTATSDKASRFAKFLGDGRYELLQAWKPKRK